MAQLDAERFCFRNHLPPSVIKDQRIDWNKHVCRMEVKDQSVFYGNLNKAQFAVSYTMMQIILESILSNLIDNRTLSHPLKMVLYIVPWKHGRKMHHNKRVNFPGTHLNNFVEQETIKNRIYNLNSDICRNSISSGYHLLQEGHHIYHTV